jgi:hypothetical protein
MSKDKTENNSRGDSQRSAPPTPPARPPVRYVKDSGQGVKGKKES